MSKLTLRKPNMGSLTRKINRFGLVAKKHSPTLFVIAGSVGVVASTILACRATLKVNEEMAEEKTNIEKLHKKVEKGFTEDYTEKEYKQELTRSYGNCALIAVKTYAPAVILGGLSLTAIIHSHKVLNTRNAALSAAYAGVYKEFKDYRKRVVERFGEELDRELRFDIRETEVEEKVTNSDGTETTVKTVKKVAGIPVDYSDNAKCFTEGCRGWYKSPEFSLNTLIGVQAWFNEKLKSRGHVFLNEVYEELGFQTTRAGHTLGWIYDKNAENPSYIDFGIHDINKPDSVNFVNGLQNSIWLDFNVDGNIYDLLF